MRGVFSEPFTITDEPVLAEATLSPLSANAVEPMIKQQQSLQRQH
jgi:hypothetical protein